MKHIYRAIYERTFHLIYNIYIRPSTMLTFMCILAIYFVFICNIFVFICVYNKKGSYM